jgi:hypothetical protein
MVKTKFDKGNIQAARVYSTVGLAVKEGEITKERISSLRLKDGQELIKLGGWKSSRKREKSHPGSICKEQPAEDKGLKENT